MTTRILTPRRLRAHIMIVAAFMTAVSCRAQLTAPPQMTVTADKPSGVYQVDDIVHWKIQWKADGPAPAISYVLKRGGLTDVGHGVLNFQDNVATLDAPLPAPNTLLLELNWPDGHTDAGVVAAPEKIRPARPAPADFDAFWQSKIKELSRVPFHPQIQTEDSGKPNVAYWKITLDNIRGTHIQGQIARPAGDGKFPAILIMQWAGVYALQKNWVTDRARDGWLAMDIESHDISIDETPAFYTIQAQGSLWNYWNIGNDNRETSYYLRMYLSCYQAIEYLKTRPDWNGKTLVVTGTSQGGQQTLMIAGLHPKNITAAVALVPAACDMLAPQAGRASGFPNWYFNTAGKDEKKVREASRYFDPANFTPRIRCPILIGLGLEDTTASPSSILAASNAIDAPMERIILVDSGHQNVNGSQDPFNRRAYGVWLPALAQGKTVLITPQKK